MTQTLSFRMIEDALYRADLEPEDVVREDYSGRGMYGDKCFGLVVDNVTQLIPFFLELADDGAGEVARDLARAMRSDNMGLSMIYYFPGYELDGER